MESPLSAYEWNILLSDHTIYLNVLLMKMEFNLNLTFIVSINYWNEIENKKLKIVRIL